MPNFRLALLVLLGTGLPAATDWRAVRAQEGPGSTELEYRVVGGTIAAERAWPWQVAIYVRRSDGNFAMSCGGTVINARWVLSAADCFIRRGDFAPRGASEVLVIEGTNQIDFIR